MVDSRRKRAPNADPIRRLYFTTTAIEALRQARWLAAGFDLFPGDRDRLDRMPEAVRAAVLLAGRPNSRYLSAPVKRLRAATKQARAEGRAKVRPAEWSPALARAEAAPMAYDPPPRVSTIVPPAQLRATTAQILTAIAAEAGVSVPTIRAWMDALQDALGEADAPARAAAHREAGFDVSETDLRRKNWERRRPKGCRVSAK
ncbi:MAG: hypothetical protein K2X46_20095 [Roseomonas sp.]|nr:hypothetical protein [Roseomonas sp.]